MLWRIQIRALYGKRRWIASGLSTVSEMIRGARGPFRREGTAWVVDRNTRGRVRTYRISDPAFEEVVKIVRFNSTFEKHEG